MDVPFVSSGAMSRAHYALVRKVETATSPQAASSILLSEVEAIHNRLVRLTMTTKQIKEALIILLYCATAIESSVSLDLTFALPHAISLAEAGQTVQDKRIGYLFCVELMPRNHELQLMLVNTLRKDLESRSTSKICLALDTLVQFSPEDVIPAIQDRLFAILSHPSPHVRKRTLYSYKVLAAISSDILKHVADKLHKRAEDTDPTVVNAALTVALELVNNNLLSKEKCCSMVSRTLHQTWQPRTARSEPWLLAKILQAFTSLEPSPEDFAIIAEIAQARSLRGSYANVLRYHCFMIAQAHPHLARAGKPPTGSSMIKSIRSLLTSENVNDLYTFVICLHSISVELWAGTTAEFPPVLDGWEVERIMTLLDSSDSLIRTKTIRILLSVDRNIVNAYFSRLSAHDFSALMLREYPEAIRRPLEIIELTNGEDSEAYVQQAIHLLQNVYKAMEKPFVYQDAVEIILTHIRNASSAYRSGCLGFLFTFFSEADTPLDPTTITILSALICEYLDCSPIPPEKLLHGLARILPMQGAALQEACLVTMIRVLANCEDIPGDILPTVQKVKETAGRQIKRRCDQFLHFSEMRLPLKDIIARTKSSSLPDFLFALEAYEAKTKIGSPTSRSARLAASPERSSSRASSHTASKLRYAAYESPKPAPRIRRLSSSSSRSTDTHRYDSEEVLSRTLTPGDLALAGGRTELIESSRQTSPIIPQILNLAENDLASKIDLIALDSPFVSEPIASQTSSIIEPDFEKVWDSFINHHSRGWCETSIDLVVRQLQTLDHPLRVTPSDQPPFKGDFKITVSVIDSDDAPQALEPAALLRLRESDDDSCLWHLRTKDKALQASIKALLSDI